MAPSFSYKHEIEKASKKCFNRREDYREYSDEQLSGITKNVLPYDVCLLSLHGNLNVGTSIRSAHLCGASNVYIWGRRFYDRRSTVGSEFYCNVEKFDGLDSELNIDYNGLFEMFKTKQIIPVFIEQHRSAIKLEHVKWETKQNKTNGQRYCFVFGNESSGIPTEFIEKCLSYFKESFIIELSQLNIVRSYNVASAVSIICYSFMSNYLSKYNN